MIDKEYLTGVFNNILPATFQDSETYLEQLILMRNKLNEVIEVMNLIVDSGGSGYILPPATSEKLGGVKVGANLTISEDGVLSAEAGGGVLTASVEQTENGAVITITDKTGTTTAIITNGATGETGPQGPQGPDGFSPTATVEQTPTGAVITITDKTGTTTATITNGSGAEIELGQGLKYVDGKITLNLGANLYFTEDGKVNAVKGESHVITQGIADEISIQTTQNKGSGISETIDIGDSIVITKF